MAVQIVLYEDNEYLRTSLKSLILWSSDFELVAAMPDATTILEDIETLHPDVILMDIDMPPSNGVDALVLLRKSYPDLPVIMLTVFEDNDNIINAICAGASGYLLKKDMEQVIGAITDVLQGGAPMTGSVAKKVLQLFPKKKIENTEVADSLTKRESEILNLLVKGFSYKMIAVEIALSVETVRTHIKKIYKKLHVNSATEAVYKRTNGSK